MNEVKKRYRESKKQLKEELSLLKNENYQLKTKLKLISNLSSDTSLLTDLPTEKKEDI
jgi:hypothetical protein